MRITYIIIFIFLTNFELYSQEITDDNEHFIYGAGELVMGNYFGLGASFNYIFKNKYSAQAGIMGAISRPESRPFDYKPGFLKGGPYDHIRDLHLLIGKVFILSDDRRLNVQAGAGYSSMLTPGSWTKANNNLLSKNYEYIYYTNREYSFICKVKLEALANYFSGLSFTGNYIVNKDTYYLGISIGVLIGLVAKEDY
jgi:hypothetical protein